MKKVLIIAVVLTLGTLSGCNNFLDKMPDNRAIIDNQDKIKALLVTAYPLQTYAPMLDARCDGYIDRGTTSKGEQPSSSFDHISAAFQWLEYPATETNDSPEAYWQGCYAAIAVCNHALEAIQRLPDPTTANKEKGEALVARAYSHFCLLSIYSNMFDLDNMYINPGIPYVDEVEDVVIKPYDRGTVASTLERIKDDLSTGMQLVGGEGSYDQPAFHFTQQSARAFAARLSLFLGDYASAIVYANSIIPSPTKIRTLNRDGVPFLNEDGTLVGVVWTDDPAQSTLKNYLHDWDAYFKLGNADAAGLAFTGSARKTNMLLAECSSLLSRSQSGSWAVRHVLSKKGFTEVYGSNITFGTYTFSTSYSVDSGESPFQPKFYEDFKYEDITAGVGQVFTKIALLRMEETLLIRAEAYAMTGEYQKAIYDLQMYAACRIKDYNPAGNYIAKDDEIDFYGKQLKKADHFINSPFNAERFTEPTGTYNDLLQKAIVLNVLDFRRAEFMWEGMRYFDILRWNIPVTHTTVDGRSSTLTPDDNRRVVQIPQMTEISGLKKNEYTPQAWR